MAKYKDDGKAYLSMYPEIAKRWINECGICHCQGYKPEMPEKICSVSNQANIKKHLMSYFQPLAVNEIGICEQCEKLYRRQ